jgi:spore germination cell wall hydrolase CwlJ-like protein
MSTTTFSDNDILIGTLTLYGEARGSTHADRVAIAHTILNRMRARAWWGKSAGPRLADHSMAAICLKPMQFSCWNTADPNSQRLGALAAKQQLQLADPVIRACLLSLLEATDGDDYDPTQGATHYLTASLHNSTRAPAWSLGRPFIEIGAHRFFSGIT